MDNNGLPGESMKLCFPVIFYAKDTRCSVFAQELQVSRNGKRDDFRMIIMVDHQTLLELERCAFFHNTPKNRLTAVEGGFSPALPVFLEIALQSSLFPSLPSGDSDWQKFFTDLPSNSPLLQESSWNAISVWVEIGQNPCIKVGYQTIFSEPANEIDWLKRRGPVTEAVVCVLIERQIPVQFEPSSHTLRIEASSHDLKFAVSLLPLEEKRRLGVWIQTVNKLPTDAEILCAELVSQANVTALQGEFSITMESFRFYNEMEFPQDLYLEQAVIDFIFTCVEIIQPYAARLYAINQ